MRILYFSPRQCWPRDTGAKLRDYYLASQLAAHCPVTYFGLRDPADASSEPPPAESGFAAYHSAARESKYTVSKLVRGLIGPTPLTVLNYSSAPVSRLLAEILLAGSFDAVQIEGVHLSAYLPVIRSAASRPVILSDWHNIESEILHRYSQVNPSLMRRAYAWRTANLLEGAETRLLAACEVHTVTSERERALLQVRNPAAEIHVIPNGVDVQYFRSQEMDPSAPRTNLLFAGSMDYSANVDAVVWFVNDIWPKLSRQHPALSFTIVGRDPKPEVRSLAGDRVSVTGTVPDVRPYYSGALAAVVPLRIGSGTRLKILEAMAAGIPVISTRLGAEGLDLEDGTHLLLADSAAEMIAVITRLATSPELWLRLSRSAREVVSRSYDWRAITENLYRIHCDVVERARPQRAF
ncbi:MAG: glycosyltransferase [Acidobacteriota bacterium]|nr:glycosyltransferase [Acidobacteriota bacterium]